MAHITPQLLEILRCPVTGSTLTQDGDALVASGEDDRGSTPRYRLHEGIPIMLGPTPAEDAGKTAGAE
ncbi:MAG: hypothetical protein L0J68_02880 [Micrococcaceae bacterium]|uniref:Trm112 family protein n=1 Tax=Arthrobacter sp. 179 TaxID=3457734 RepID=UPI00264F2686|nr:hypothetical protein [Micrococcaceae bacterium]MDN5812521.1 hypothetical protein [Micrococcaceae bacterium]MDN5825094.1 hypothetical protein [Micrococcaceae bacterium]MDN5878880.1 hypothetical protein [Micrococcaceae bacterium]MDN5885661.1 hypothetical protein [Micrococcaceae bacterium]